MRVAGRWTNKIRNWWGGGISWIHPPPPLRFFLSFTKKRPTIQTSWLFTFIGCECAYDFFSFDQKIFIQALAETILNSIEIFGNFSKMRILVLKKVNYFEAFFRSINLKTDQMVWYNFQYRIWDSYGISYALVL